MELITQCYEKGEINKHDELVNIISDLDGWTENDSRFLNMFLLEKLRRRLAINPKFSGYQWHSYKNDISGVWLANYDSEPTCYNFSDEIRELQKKHSAKMWFHIELGKGILVKDLTEAVGTFQLKTATEQDNWGLLEEFRQIRTARPDECSPKKVKKNAGTFSLMSRGIPKNGDLILRNLENDFTAFCERFGAFI